MTLTKVFSVDPLNPCEEVLKICCEVVKGGGIVVFPTETVYGLGASAFNGEAVKKIFIAKGRPADNPLIVHISRVEQLYEVADSVPEEVLNAVKVFWPGPFTVIVRKSTRVVKEVTAGLPTVAVRMPAHPVALKLIDCAGPIAAPSANISGRPSPTTGFHVMMDMFGRVDAIIDAGETLYGVESTIIDTTSKPYKLLRPGAMPIEKIAEVLRQGVLIPVQARGLGEFEKALAPGMRYKHYSPETPVILVEGPDPLQTLKKVVEELVKEGKRVVAVVSSETAENLEIPIRLVTYGSRANLFEIAKNLFKVLREIDSMGVDIAVIEGVEEKGLGLAVMNRLRKAASKIV
jgi:L-threonylcarbamoyladenylate synthase